MKNKKIMISVLQIVFPFCVLFAQKSDTTMAILEDKQHKKETIDYLYAQKKEHNRTLVLYKNKFYSLSDFDLIEKVSNTNLELQIINQPDSIANKLHKEVVRLIILKDK